MSGSDAGISDAVESAVIGGPFESPGEVARIAEVTPELVRQYVKAGLIACVVDASGRRSFPPGTGLRVRALKAERMIRKRPTRAES